MMRRGFLFPLLMGMTLLFVPLAQADKQFESPHVHPIELSPDGTKLFAVNTPDHRLTVYDMTSGSPVLLTEIQVGMEPSTVRARSNTEVWVVNHISDSISIIDLNTMSVVKTLLVGDEPTDVVFAGSPEKAFVCMSQLDLIRVYDTTNLAAAPVDIPLDACDPFALSLSPAGDKLYVASLDSQNNTTIVPEATVDSTLGLPPPSPPMDTTLAAAPMVGLIVRHDGTNWLDELNRSWDQYITYELYD
ncbi:MAG: YncE family protein, partial [Candidatus Eisenbacteria bacterium]|nr:YncE family protein [Candidatus Eisenbacteria bacterium]